MPLPTALAVVARYEEWQMGLRRVGTSLVTAPAAGRRLAMYSAEICSPTRIEAAAAPRAVGASYPALPEPSAVAPHRALGLDDATLVRQYELMLLARRISERSLKLSLQGRVAITIPCDGHEAAQVGSVLALRPVDIIHPFYRGLGAVLARGLTVREIFLDLLARAESPSSGGRQMPGHWSRPELRVMTPSSSVGTQAVTAVGSALASKLRRADEVSIAYFGDGATSKGDFHEALNTAAVWKLPVVFFCENNQYAISVPFEKQSAVPRVADRAAAYGLPGVSVDGMDLLAVYAATREAVERARGGGGPTLIEARVYRFSLHTSHVGLENYRDPAEIELARQRDPLLLTRRYLEEQGLFGLEREAELERRVGASIEDGLAFAEAAAVPDPATASRHLFAETASPKGLLS